jgi:hypothetical protein
MTTLTLAEPGKEVSGTCRERPEWTDQVSRQVDLTGRLGSDEWLPAPLAAAFGRGGEDLGVADLGGGGPHISLRLPIVGDHWLNIGSGLGG